MSRAALVALMLGVLALGACGSEPIVGPVGADAESDSEADSEASSDSGAGADGSDTDVVGRSPDADVAVSDELSDVDADVDTDALSAPEVEPEIDVGPACPPAEGTLGCGELVPATQLTTAAGESWGCGAPALVGSDRRWSFVPEVDGLVRVSVDASPAEIVWVGVLDEACDCIYGQALGGPFVVGVKGGETYQVLVDAEVGGIVKLAGLLLECSAGEICGGEGGDEDWDGLADCADPDCGGAELCEPVEASCADGEDNDGDALVDCLDGDCDGVEGCELGLELTCGDGLDNDGDGATDCADEDCVGVPDCLVPCADKAVPLACGEDPQSFSATSTTWFAHSCAPGEWEMPDQVFLFQPTTSGTAALTLFVSIEEAVVTVYEGGCEGTCVDAWYPDPFHEVTGPGFAFEAGQSYVLAVDGTGYGATSSLSLGSVALTCAP